MWKEILEKLEKDSLTIEQFRDYRNNGKQEYFIEKGFLANSASNKLKNVAFKDIYYLFHSKNSKNLNISVSDVKSRKNMNIFLKENNIPYYLVPIDVQEEVNGRKRIMRLNVWIRDTKENIKEDDKMSKPIDFSRQIPLKDLQNKIRNKHNESKSVMATSSDIQNTENGTPQTSLFEESTVTKTKFQRVMEDIDNDTFVEETYKNKDEENSVNLNGSGNEYIKVSKELIYTMNKIQSRFDVFFSELKIDMFDESTVWLLLNCPNSILQVISSLIKSFDHSLDDSINRRYKFIIDDKYCTIKQVIYKGSKDIKRVNDLGKILHTIPSSDIK